MSSCVNRKLLPLNWSAVLDAKWWEKKASEARENEGEKDCRGKKETERSMQTIRGETKAKRKRKVKWKERRSFVLTVAEEEEEASKKEKEKRRDEKKEEKEKPWLR